MKKFIIAIAILAFLSSPAYAVTRYWVGGGSSGNWNATGNTNWGSASGTRDNQAVPTATEDVVFDDHANGNTPCTVTAAATAKTVTFTGGTGWTNTFTINTSQTLTVSGNVTLNSGMTYAGAGTLVMSTAGSVLDTNTKVISGGLQIGSNSITLAENTDVNGTFTQISGDSGALSAAGATTLNIGGGLNNTRKTTLTNVTIILDGTGTWTGSSTNGRYIDGPVTINTAGTITMSTPSWGGGTLTYTAGTISSGTTTFYLMETGTMSGAFPSTAFYNLGVTAASTLTIDNALYVTNNLALGASLTMSGDYAFDPANISTSATSTLTIVRPITVPGTVSLSANLTMAGNYNTIFTNITGVAAGTLTAVNSIQGINTIRANEGIALTFAGNFPQICKNLQVDAAGSLIFPSDYELTVTDSLISNGTSFDTTTIRGATANREFKLKYLGTPANQQVTRTTFTDVCACNGSAIYNMFGTSSQLTRTKNIWNVSFPLTTTETMFGFPKMVYGG